MTPVLEPIGLALHPLFSYLNHDCVPNATLITNTHDLGLRAEFHINENTEVTISYIVMTNPFPKRRHDLQTGWGFTCQCSICQRAPFHHLDAFRLPPSEAPNSFAGFLLDNIRRDPAKVPECYDYGETELGPQSRLYSAAHAFAWSFYDRANQLIATQPPISVDNEAGDGERRAVVMKARGILVDGLLLCKRSGMFEAFREPCAVMRDEYVLQCLEMGDYREGLQHALYGYFMVWPMQWLDFPPWHINRTVKLARLVKLLLFSAYNSTTARLSSAEPPSTVELPFPTAVALRQLAGELVKNVTMSTGNNSAFLAWALRMQQVVYKLCAMPQHLVEEHAPLTKEKMKEWACQVEF